MDQSSEIDDRAFGAELEAMAKDGKLLEYITDLLAQADQPEFDVGDVGVAMQISGGVINDKSCYKRCFWEDIRHPGTYAKCIKKCRPKSSFSLEVFAPA